MKQGLHLKLGQNLALTPQLQQSIRLLQLSTLELQQELQQALQDNPLLELQDDPDQPSSLHQDTPHDNTSSPNPDTSQDTNPDTAQAADPSEPVARESIEGMLDNWAGDWRDNTGNPDEDDETSSPELAGPTHTLQTHLLEQLRLTQASERDKNLVMWLIDALNDDGFLNQGLEDIWESLQHEPDLDVEELHTALHLLQSFDPPGVGARNAAECLLLQLPFALPPAQNPKLYASCHALIAEHLPLLAQHDYTRIKRLLKLSDDELKHCLQVIQGLNPSPGSAFLGDSNSPTPPDVLVKKVQGQWVVQLNPEVLPRIRVHSGYASIVRQQRSQHSALNQQLQEARWLIKNIQQRFETILRVSQAIVERQLDYFDHGAKAMQPLILRDIADTLGLHESTVSRVTSQKYMLTPHGLVELKYFFGSHVATHSGGQASSTAIRALIQQLIANEDRTNPVSDSQIAECLQQQGIVVARRTVAKYREALKIPPVNMRKTL